MERGNYQNLKIIVLIITALLFVSGCVWFAKPKPEKTQPPREQSVENLPPPVDFNKYKTEPQISVYMAATGTKKYMSLEQYLEGVIAAEMGADWPLEALKAQAVVARTLTLNAIEQKTVQRNRQTDVSTDKAELQAYNAAKVNERVRKAVKETRGMVMIYKSAFVNAIYNACCGQKTAIKTESYAKEIPYDADYFHTIDCPCYDYTPEQIKYWSLQISNQAWSSAVGYDGPVEDITIIEKGPSGRALYIGTDHRRTLGSDVRGRIGYDKMKSTLITNIIYQADGTVFLEGKGWGNGVGMCQWGAYTWAQRGQSCDFILHYYYKDVTLQKIWE